MTELMKLTIIQALDMKIASAKRAKNTNKNPKFMALYDDEIAECLDAQKYIKNLK